MSEDAKIAGALRSALTAEGLRAALLQGPSRQRGLEGAVAELRDRILAEFESHDLAAHEPGEAASSGEAPADKYRLRLSFADEDRVPLPTRTAEVELDRHEKAFANLTCTQCRRPVKLELMVADPKARQPGHAGSKHAYVAVLADGKATSFLQAFILGLSLAKFGRGPSRVLIHSPSVPGVFLQVLRTVWELTSAPAKSWPEIFRHPIFMHPRDERLLRLRALGLKFDKVPWFKDVLLLAGLCVCFEALVFYIPCYSCKMAAWPCFEVCKLVQVLVLALGTVAIQDLRDLFQAAPRSLLCLQGSRSYSRVQ